MIEFAHPMRALRIDSNDERLAPCLLYLAQVLRLQRGDVGVSLDLNAKKFPPMTADTIRQTGLAIAARIRGKPIDRI